MSTKGMLVLCLSQGQTWQGLGWGWGQGLKLRFWFLAKQLSLPRAAVMSLKAAVSEASCILLPTLSDSAFCWPWAFPLANNIEDAVLLNELSGHKSSASARPSDPSYQSSVFKDPGSSSSAPWHSGPLFLWVWVTYKNETKMCVIFSCQAYTMSTQTLKEQRRGIHSPKCVGWVRN